MKHEFMGPFLANHTYIHIKQKDPHNIVMYTKSFFFPTVPGPHYIYLICPFLPFSIHLIMKKEREMGREEGNKEERKEGKNKGRKEGGNDKAQASL